MAIKGSQVKSELIFTEIVKPRSSNSVAGCEFVCMAYWYSYRIEDDVPVSIYKIKATGEIGHILPREDHSLKMTRAGAYKDFQEWFDNTFGEILSNYKMNENLLLDIGD